MKVVRETLICTALASLTLCLMCGFIVLGEMPRILHSEAEATRAALAAQTHLAIVDANNRLADALTKFDSQITVALGEVHLASVNADKRTGQALNIVRFAAANTGVTLANAETDLHRLTVDTNSQMSTLNATVATTLKPAGEAAQQVNKALPDFLDCQIPTNEQAQAGWKPGNPGCLYFRFEQVGLAAKAVSAATPSLVSSADKIAASSVDTSVAVADTGKQVAIAAKKFNAPQTKWQAFRSWALTAARIFGAL